MTTATKNGQVRARKGVVIDLSEYDILFEEDQEAEVAGTFKLAGQTFRVLAGVNSYRTIGIEAGDAGSFREQLTEMVHEDDREAFAELLGRPRSLPTTKLIEMFTKIIEVAAERPTS